ncbi:MAG: hypothetical protein AAF458_12685 [Pseudomonadota bacterium]
MALSEIIRKARTRGPGWVWRRTREELRTPSSPLGLRIRPLVRGTVDALEGLQALTARAVLRTGQGAAHTLYLYYDLETCPITFDFAWVLCAAECRRIELGLRHIHVVFVPGADWSEGRESAEYACIVDHDAREWRFSNVLIPLCSLLPSVSGYELASSRRAVSTGKALTGASSYPQNYSPLAPETISAVRDVFRYASTGVEVRHLRAGTQATRYIRAWIEQCVGQRRLVTMTMRQYGYQSYRNSNVPAWTEFAQGLDSDRYFPVVIPETDAALSETNTDYGGVPVMAAAAFNVRLRMALYEQAWVNLSTNSGPFITTFLNAGTRCAMLKILGAETPEEVGHNMHQIGFEIDAQLPFSGPAQRLLWRTDDDVAGIRAGFKAVVDALEE